MNVRSSAIDAMPGSTSDTQAPLLPRWWNFCGVPSSFGTPLVKAKVLPLMHRIRARLSVVLDQLGLVVEHIEVRRRPGHVQNDDVLRPCGKMRFVGGERFSGVR